MPSCLSAGLLAVTIALFLTSLTLGLPQMAISNLLNFRVKKILPTIGFLTPIPVSAVLIFFLVQGTVSIQVGSKEVVLASKCGEKKEEESSPKPKNPLKSKNKTAYASLSKDSCYL